jgi:hypothetical protein
VLSAESRVHLRGRLVLARLRRAQGRVEEAMTLAAATAETLGRLLGVEHPLYLDARMDEARALVALGQLDAAVRPALEALEGRRRVFGDDHPVTREAGMLVGDLPAGPSTS